MGSYGLSKAVAALVAGLVLARALQRRGLPSDAAWSLVLPAVLWGFLGAKLYYLAEHASSLTWDDFGGTGFTWYGGMIAATIAVLVVIHRPPAPPGPGQRPDRGATVAGLRHRAAGMPAGRRRHLRPTHRPALGDGVPARDGTDHPCGDSRPRSRSSW